jgi:glycosyltransferase involved in cell wall biosynthesis
MRVALLSYRSKPHCGGQGIYIRHLSRELTNLGHEVEVFSGQPYPVLDPGVRLTKVPSLDLYREPDPFRVPKLREFRDRIDVQEFAIMCLAGFPEARTFSRRVARLLAERADEFDIAHDNQVLGYGMLDIEDPDKVGLPLITTVHHPITFDRRIDLSQTRNPWRQVTLRRWYGFLRMQGKVARRARRIMTPSETSKVDIAKDFGVDPAKMEVILLGVDDVFVPPTTPRVPGRIMAMASADAPMKGVATLLEAFAKLRTERDVELILVTKPQAGGLMGSAEVACVPSLYEGFSLPTAELMACGTPLVVSRAGAIPEVVGPDGLCADLVTPGDVGEFKAALENMLDDPERRDRMGAAGRGRVEELFSWRAVATKVAAAYEEVISEYQAEHGPRTSRSVSSVDR